MTADAITVFFSYSHQDEALRDELANHLEILKWNGDISDWHDRKIPPGNEWDYEIKESLNSAQIILLLISADFIASRYCRDIEITRAMERHEAGEACVIPVILRRCLWSSAPFGKLQALPKNAAPVTDTITWSTKDDAFTNIAEGIRRAAQEIRQKLIAAHQEKLDQYETAYQKAIQQTYPLSEATQETINRLQAALHLSDEDIAPIVTRLSAQIGQGRQKLEQYRHEVSLCLKEDSGELSAFSQIILDGFRISFGLTPEEATAVEAEEFQPIRAKQEAKAQYGKVFVDALKIENPLTEGTRRRLQRFQQTLGLSNAEVEIIEAEVPEPHPPEPKPPDVSRKDLSECDLSKILFIKNVRDPGGNWAYTLNLIQRMNGSFEGRIFELFWLPSSKGAKAASKGDLMLLNQQAKITHIVEMLDDDVRENSVGYFRWVRVVWMPEEPDWSKLPHQREVIGFEPPTIGGGTAYSLANLSKFQETWNSLEAFQQHVFQVLTGTEHPIAEVNGTDDLSSEKGIDYTRLRDLLKAQDWRAADEETYEVMLQAVGKKSGDWFSRDELLNFPYTDIRTIDRLWVKYSQGKFGFSVQKQIYVECGAKLNGSFPGHEIWDEFCERLGWSKDDKWISNQGLKADPSLSPAGEFPLFRWYEKSLYWHGELVDLWNWCWFSLLSHSNL